MTEKFYLTTAIDYVNAPPHLGHAYEKIAADALARYHRLRGAEVFFLTGVDEHGMKIEKTAAQAGITPQELADRHTPLFIETWQQLGISYDHFIRTTDPDHERAVQQAFSQLLEQGDIYKASYEGLYCTGCEEFKNERDLSEGRCPQHPQEALATHSEENYIFRLSAYKQRLREHIESHTDFIAPVTRKKEALNLLEGFPDVSVSRQRLKWGIPVPGDASQVIYVWIDALLNYVTGVGYQTDADSFRRWWPAELHLVGKDITKFHCLIWPALLLALGLPLPRQIYGHGFVLMDSQKMGKSLGNAVSPAVLAEQYGTDALRYYLLREVVFGKDGEFSPAAFEKRVDSDLANNLGNALNRLLPILEKQHAGKIPTPRPESGVALRESVPALLASVESAMQELALQGALSAIWGYLDQINKFIDTQAPWTLAKRAADEPEAQAELFDILYASLEALRVVAILASPFIPGLSAKIWEQLGIPEPITAQRWQNLSWGGLQPETQTHRLGPIYPRIGSALAKDKKQPRT